MCINFRFLRKERMKETEVKHELKKAVLKLKSVALDL